MSEVVFSEEEGTPAEIPVKDNFSTNKEAMDQLEAVMQYLDQNSSPGDIERAIKTVKEYRGQVEK